MLRTRLPLVATLISAIFIASFLPANSASIAGTSCMKLNSTKTVSNIKYFCVKSGKKLVWNKGVAVQATTVKPSATPTPTASSTQIVTPTKAPTPTPTPSPITVASVDPLRIAAFESAKTHKCGNSHPNIVYTLESGPNFPQDLK